MSSASNVSFTSLFSALLTIFIGSTLFPVSTPAMAYDDIQTPPEDPIESKVDRLYVPSGFDASDRVVVVVEGVITDTCHQLGPHAVEVSTSSNDIYVRQFLKKIDAPCEPDNTPFTTIFDLGRLLPGSYRVIALGASVKDLEVATDLLLGPDVNYAAIDSVRIDRDTESWRYIATISGHFSNSCTCFTELKFTDSGDTKELFFITKITPPASGTACVEETRPFTVPLALPATMLPGRYLLHVRSFAGESHNMIFEVSF